MCRTTKSQKEVAYEHFRRLDEERIRKFHELIADDERRLSSLNGDEDHYYATHRDLVRYEAMLSKLSSETSSETEERYAELHESMVNNHDQGLSDLDFSRTGL